MHFSAAALVLSTLAFEASAHTIRHAAFHARKNEEAKRGDVDYSTVDYSGVDWKAIDWKSVFDLKNKPSATATAVPKKQVDTESESTTTPEPSATSTPTPTSSSEEAAEPTKTKESVKDKLDDIIDTVGDFLENLAEGVEDFCKEKGIAMAGKNQKSPNGGVWLGPSDWTANFHNAGDEPVWVACWTDSGFTGMTINVNQPWVLAKIPVGENQTVSFAPKVAAACAPMYPDTPLSNFGGVFNPWFEANFGPTDGSFVGTFDVSKNTRMNGDSIEAVGSKCTSNMNTCVFECTDKSVDSCEYGYELVNCGSNNGGGGGYDVVMQGVGGGCNMGASSEYIDVTFKNA